MNIKLKNIKIFLMGISLISHQNLLHSIELNYGSLIKFNQSSRALTKESFDIVINYKPKPNEQEEVHLYLNNEKIAQLNGSEFVALTFTGTNVNLVAKTSNNKETESKTFSQGINNYWNIKGIPLEKTDEPIITF